MKKKLVLVAIASIIFVLLLGCASEPETPEPEDPVDETVVEETVVEETSVEETVEETETTEEIVETVEAVERPTPTFEIIRIQFQPNSALFTDSEKAMLLTYASYLERYPDLTLLIKGHTARVGSEETSQTLSNERAQVVADFILGRTNIDESRMIVVGVGSTEPRADNDTEAGRMANRRVEISLTQ